MCVYVCMYNKPRNIMRVVFVVVDYLKFNYFLFPYIVKILIFFFHILIPSIKIFFFSSQTLNNWKK